MQFRGLLAAVGLLAVLGIGLYFSNKAEKEKEGKPPADAPPRIVEIPSDQINRIDVVKAGETTTVQRGNDGKWAIAAPKAFRADQEAVNGLANTFTALASDRLVDEKAADIKTYGLDNPGTTVTITKKDGKTVTLLLGDETPTQGNVYAKLDGDPRVFTLAAVNKTGIEKSFKDLQDKRLVTFDADKISRVEISVKGKTLEFGKNSGNEWQIVKPQTLRADGGNVEELVRKIRDAKMDNLASEDDLKKAAAEWGAAAVVAVAKVTDTAGTQVLEVRKGKENTFYAKGSALEGVYKTTADLGDGLGKDAGEYRQKKLFDFGWSDPVKVEVHDGAKALTVSKTKDEKTGDKWHDASKKEMDATSVQNLIDKLRDLKAASFPESGFTASVFDATVVSNDGKRTEKVLISQTGDSVFAKRENEPAVYQLDKQAFEDLKKAAGDVKEPPPPAKKDEKKK